MNDNCVCGFHPPEEPNLDCERCQLICKLARLREKAQAVSEGLMYLKDNRNDELIAELRAELENDNA